MEKDEKFKQTVAQRTNDIINMHKMTELSSLVIGVAHQINNPNASIRANLKNIQTIFERFIPILETISKENPNTKIGKMPQGEAILYLNKALNSIQESSQKILTVTENLKDFAENMSEKEKSHITIKDIIEEAISYSGFYTNNKIKINVKIDDNIPEIEAFMLEWQQIFSNFIINSCQSFVEKHGENINKDACIEIIAKIKEANDLFNKPFINISIIDNANGIAKEHLDKIFSPYFTTKKNSVNIGLGLSYNYGIIKRYNGFIFVKSTKNIGTTFDIQIPQNAGSTNINIE